MTNRCAAYLSAQASSCAAAALMWLMIPTASSAAPPPQFETHVQPILKNKCSKCHAMKVRKGDLDLSSMAGVRRGGESGEYLIADSLDESLLWIMVDGGGMPPEEEPQLTAGELDMIKSWLQTGAHSSAPGIPEPRELNQHDVLPIVLLRCTTCHGPRLQEGGLDLRTPAKMLAGGSSGPALVPGDPDASLMIQRIESEACPPRAKLLKFFVRRPPKSEVEILRNWIAAGAPVADIQPDVSTGEPDPLITPEERQHWAFQPPATDHAHHSVDAFIEARLHQAGLQLAPPASRDTLIRRAYLDLIGLPPSLEERLQWRSSSSPDWYPEMLEHLLASPHYGERWGRYWLDLAGYADSEGGVSADPIRAVAWKYRDYVIRAFNSDMPYDRFLIEQLAGDELFDVASAATITPEMVDRLVATGFLRMGIDQTGSRTMNFVPERLGVISDAIAVVSSGVMGLTMECARCHSHKYDPIPHRDYYRFKAIFQGALDEHDWLSFKTRYVDVATAEHRALVAKTNPPLLARIKTLESHRRKAVADLQRALLAHHSPELTPAEREATIVALKIADNNRTLPQRILVEYLQRAEVRPDSQQPEEVLEARANVEQLDREIARTQRQLIPVTRIRALWDRGDPSPTYILRRGEHDKPGRLVGPDVPSVLTDGQTPLQITPPFPDGTPKTGRRLAFARWLTQPDHPLTARVMVNRIWYHHFGTGLVKSLENFGVKGDRPSHPELLDWLARRFIERGWSIKDMHRTIMSSRTYRQSSRVSEQQQAVDPQNRLLSRMPLRRLDAEALRDSLLAVSGRLDRTPGGPPDTISVDREGEVSVNPSTEDGRWRRSVYLQYRRTEIPTLMATFDYPEMGPNCVSRSSSTVSPQSLMLLNNKRIHELAVALADRVQRELLESGTVNETATVRMVYAITLNREPELAELQVARAALEDLTTAWDGDRQAALATFCHTILNSAAFLYVD